MRTVKLEHTPFVAMTKDNKSYVIGRSDTKEMRCIGSFNNQFADMYKENDFVFLMVNEDGSASEYHPECRKAEPVDIVQLVEGGAIIATKVGCYWLVPYGFDSWAINVFNKQTSTF